MEELGKNLVFAVGAEITLEGKGHRTQSRRAYSDGSYLSSSSFTVYFGLGEMAGVEGVVGQWPDGSEGEFCSVKILTINYLLEVNGKRVKTSDQGILSRKSDQISSNSKTGIPFNVLCQ